MKHRRVFGWTAECALSLRHGLSRPVLPRLSELAVVGGQTTPRAGLKSHLPRHPHAEWKVNPYRQPSIHPHASATEDVSRPEQLRAMMRLMTHSVVVCTSVSVSDAAPRGMTMSSFNSLSLDPPTVTFHVATPSRTLDAVRECKKFNVHVLAGDVAGAKVADWFTRGNLKEGVWEAGGLESVDVRIESQIDGGAGAKKTQEPPILQGKGVLYVLRCRLLDGLHDGVVVVNNHAIVLGEVLDILEGSARVHSDERFSLVYADRRYRQLGSTLVKIPADGDTNQKD